MKTWYMSKTLWLNVVALVVLVIQTYTGFVVDIEAQAGLLAVINLILRAITGTSLSWGNTPAATEPINTYPPDAGIINLRCLVLFLIASLLLCAILLTSGCATTSPTSPPSANDTPQVRAGKSLLAVKSTIVVAATSVDTLCKNGTLKIDTCTKASVVYEQVKPAYDAAVDAYLLMSSMGGDAADFGRTLTRVQALAADLLALSGGAH